MIDQPVIPTEAKVAQSSAGRNSRHSKPHAPGPVDESAFQSVLAQELKTALADQAAQPQAAPGLTVKAGAGATPLDDTTLTAADDAAADTPTGTGTILTFPTLPDVGIALPEVGIAPPEVGIALPEVGIALSEVGIALPDVGIALPDVGIALRTTGAASLPPAGPANAGTARLKAPFDSSQDPLLKGSAARDAANQLSMASKPADFAASGKLASPVEGGMQRDVAFSAGLFDQHHAGVTTAPLPSPAAAALAGQSGAATAPLPAPVPVATIDARFGAQAWNQGLGDKLVWMAGQKHQVAELHLNPPDLGPLKITLTLNDDQATAQFISAHATVRETIESAMPRLREMLAESGITLGNADVSADTFREQAQAQQQQRAYPASGADAALNAGAPVNAGLSLRRSLALVDTFA